MRGMPFMPYMLFGRGLQRGREKNRQRDCCKYHTAADDHKRDPLDEFVFPRGLDLARGSQTHKAREPRTSTYSGGLRCRSR
jgi:hypothetical protein